MSRQATIKDVARALGVSPATVSRALAGNRRISTATRERVVRAAAAAGYVPNRAAQSLVSGRASGFVGLVMTDPGYGRGSSFLADFMSGLGRELAARGIDLFLSTVPSGQEELPVIRNIVLSRRADGLILPRTAAADPRVEFLLDAGFPFVTHGRAPGASRPYSWVDSDGGAAFAEAFGLLYGLGHRHFGLVTIDEPMGFRADRTEGLRRAIAGSADPAVRLSTASAPRHDRSRRRAAIRALLEPPDRPTAVIALFDGLALDVYGAAKDLGLAIPGDLSVTGFDDIAGAEAADPGLTTFDPDTVRAGRAAAERLLAQLDAGAGAPPDPLLIAPKLVLRGSHGPAPAKGAATRTQEGGRQ